MGENEHCVLLRLTRLVRTGGVSHQKKKKAISEHFEE